MFTVVVHPRHRWADDDTVRQKRPSVIPINVSASQQLSCPLPRSRHRLLLLTLLRTRSLRPPTGLFRTVFSRISFLVPAPPDPSAIPRPHLLPIGLPRQLRWQDGAGRDGIRHPHRLAEPPRQRLVLHHRLVALVEVGRVLAQPLAYAAMPPDDPPLRLTLHDRVVNVALEVLEH